MSLWSTIKAPLAVAAAPFTGGTSLGLLGKDTLLGKKDTGTPDRLIDLDPSLKAVVEQARPIQQQGLTGLSGYMKNWQDMNPMAMGNLITQNKVRGLREGADATKRNANQLIARRGMAGTSLGLKAAVTADRDARKGITEAVAQNPIEQANALAKVQGGYKDALSGVNSILSTPGEQTQLLAGRQGTGQRSGGLLGLAGTIGGAALGGMYGGAQGVGPGAQVGGGLGYGLSNLF